MEGKGKAIETCKFFLQGKCKNGARCAFSHNAEEKAVSKKQSSREEKHSESEQRTEVELKDPEAIQKIEYLRGLKESLKLPCKSCKQKKLLSIISCGCENLCRSCALKAKKCPDDSEDIDHDFIIGGQLN